jgi:pyruvate dehydrogenase E2 component (dihydrolipoamide acetyltransferase)
MTETTTPSVSPIARKLADKLGVDLATIKGSGPNGTIVRADIEGAAAVAGGSPAPAVAPAAEASDGSPPPVSPIALRIAEERGIDLATIKGTGPNGRIVRADVENAIPGRAPVADSRTAPAPTALASPTPVASAPDIPHELAKLSSMRKTIARRLAESKREVPHIYLAVDVRLDALLKLRGELNRDLAASGVKLSVNDMLIKALGQALLAVPCCNVSFAGDRLLTFSRADISVAVSLPGGLITPIIVDAGRKSLSAISTEMAELLARAKEGKLQPHEFQGGTASLSNMGMMGINHFSAVINSPQGIILAIGAGEQRPVVTDGMLGIATVMTATGSFDHRAIDGADGAQLMAAFKQAVEAPFKLLV